MNNEYVLNYQYLFYWQTYRLQSMVRCKVSVLLSALRSPVLQVWHHCIQRTHVILQVELSYCSFCHTFPYILGYRSPVGMIRRRNILDEWERWWCLVKSNVGTILHTLNCPLSPTGARKPSAPADMSFWQYEQTFRPFLKSSKHSAEQNCFMSYPNRTQYFPKLADWTAPLQFAQQAPKFFWYFSAR